MKLLFIDDQIQDSNSAARIASDEFNLEENFEVANFDFENFQQTISETNADIIILDLMKVEDGGDPVPLGKDVCEWVWEQKFCPIIVYSAYPNELPDKYESHPFVIVVQKGVDSLDELNSAVTQLTPQVESISQAEYDARQEFSFALREVAPLAFKLHPSDPEKCNEIIKRSGRRRLAALMDDLSRHGDEERLASWELYLCPPVCKGSIQLGDVIRCSNSSWNDPGSFYIVLTPSCDMVCTEGRNPKVEKVLVTACRSMQKGFDLTSMKAMSKRKVKERISQSVLTQGSFESIIPFPELEGHIPTMVASLRHLALIPIGDIGEIGSKYLRIASIDSPFRESISWAFMQSACRPGVPDRDNNVWKDEIIQDMFDDE